MADDPQLLSQFIESLLGDLSSGAITPEEALSACNQYQYLREALQSRSSELSSAALLGEEHLQSAVVSIITNVNAALGNLPSFGGQSPDKPAPEEQIRNTASLEKLSIDRVKKDAAEKLGAQKEKRRAFVHDLVTAYSARNRGKSISDTIMDRAATAALAQDSQSKEGFADYLVTSLASIGAQELDAENTIAFKSAVGAALITHEEQVAVARQSAQKQKFILDTLFENPTIERPDVVVDMLIHAPPGQPLDEVRVRALKLAEVAAALEKTKGPLPVSKDFFSSANARGVSKGAQQAADGLLSLVGEPFREILIKEKINGTLRKLFTDTQTLTDRLGQSFVSSPVFAQLSQSMTKQAAQAPSASQARGVFDDVFGSIFRGPLTQPTNESTKEQVFNFFELARANANAPSGKRFLPAWASPWNVFGAPAALREQQYALSGKTSGERASLGSRGSLLPAFGLGALGSWAGGIFSAGFDRSVSSILNNPRLPLGLSGARRAAAVPVPFFEDMPKLVATVAVIALLLLFILPTPFNGALVNHSSKVSSLLASLIQADPEESETTNDNGWPVKCGCISQGPGEGTHDGGDLNAVDFLFGTCSPSAHVDLFATEDGVVTTVSQQYGVGDRCIPPPPGQFAWNCGGKSSYGNFLIIHTDSGQDLLYGHLSSFTVSQGSRVTKGDKVGESDDNGVTDIEHLHFEVLKTSKDNTPINQSNSVTPEAAVNGLCV